MTIEELKKQSLKDLEEIRTPEELEDFRIKYLGRKGELTVILRSLKNMPAVRRKEIGADTNKLKIELTKKFEKKSKKLETNNLKTNKIDVTAPGKKVFHGHLHPISLVMKEVESIFQSMGFKIIEGFDVENEYYNFDALNIPKDHPARDLWDTFWLKTKSEKFLLRTHTSPMQVRYMEKKGLMVDRNINIANFKAIVEEFLKRLFGEDIEMRMRPGYFPFVEPGFEIDMKYSSGKWLEIMGAGMVHPNVFKAAGYVPSNWQGFAFGIGIDRVAMLKYKINDIRLFYSGDLNFLNQF